MITVRIERPMTNRVVVSIDYHIPADAPGGSNELMAYIMNCAKTGEDVVLRINMGGTRIMDGSLAQGST